MTIINFKSNSKNLKPWLNSNGLPIVDQELKEISKSWNQKTWDDYLTWFESPLKESQIDSRTYDKMADCIEESIFINTPNHANDDIKRYVDYLLELLSPKQCLVLQYIFWHGKSEYELGRHFGVTRSAIRETKQRALERIAKHLKKNDETTRYKLKTISTQRLEVI